MITARLVIGAVASALILPFACTNDYEQLDFSGGVDLGGAASGGGGTGGDASASGGTSGGDAATGGSTMTGGSGGGGAGGTGGNLADANVTGGSGGASGGATGGASGSATGGASGSATGGASGTAGDASSGGTGGTLPEGGSTGGAVATGGTATEAGPSDASCDQRYGSAAGYIFCSSDATSCTFYVTTQNNNCGSLCTGLGGTCIDANDNSTTAGQECVVANAAYTCGTRDNSLICTCSHP